MSSYRIDDEPVMPPVTTSPIRDGAGLQQVTLPISISFMWMGRVRKLTDEQQEVAAESLDAEAKSIRSSKRLFAFTKYEPLKKLSRIKGVIQKLLNVLSLPFTTPGVRLLRQELQPTFETRIAEERDNLQQAAAELQLLRSTMIDMDREKLGRAFNLADYPEDLSTHFGVTWEYLNLNPNQDLMIVDEAVYRRESERIRTQFEAAHRKAETLMAEEMRHMLENLAGRLTDVSSGASKRMPMQHVENLRDFFARFRTLNVSSDSGLEALMTQAEQMLEGIDGAADLRVEHTREALREATNAVLDAVEASGIAPRVGRRVVVQMEM